MTFDSTNIYKVFETPDSQIMRFVAPSVPPPQGVNSLTVEVSCPQCQTPSKIQANLKRSPLQPGHHRFPPDNQFKCPVCGADIDLTDARRQIEVQSKRSLVDEYE